MKYPNEALAGLTLKITRLSYNRVRTLLQLLLLPRYEVHTASIACIQQSVSPSATTRVMSDYENKLHFVLGIALHIALRTDQGYSDTKHPWRVDAQAGPPREPGHAEALKSRFKSEPETIWQRVTEIPLALPGPSFC